MVVAVASGTLLAVTALRAANPWFLGEMRERTFDAYQRLKPRPYQDFPVRVVDIDEASLAALGQWPWPRTRIAALVSRLNELGAAVIAFDVLFAEPDRTSPSALATDLQGGDDGESQRLRELLARLPDHDQVLADAIAEAPVVTAFTPIPRKNDHRPPDNKVGLAFVGTGTVPTRVVQVFAGAATNIPIIDAAAKGIGGITLSGKDEGGVVRRAPMLYSDGRKVYPSLAATALRVAQQKDSIVVRDARAEGAFSGGGTALVDMRIGEFVLPLTRTGELWAYYDRDRRERYVSVKDVLDPAKEGEVRPRIEGQIVFVGTSAAGLLDSRMTSLGQYVPGVSIHAQITEQILGRTFLSRPDWADGIEVSAMLVLGALLTSLLLMLGPTTALVVGAVVISLAGAGSWFAFSSLGLLFDPIYPSLGAAAVYAAVVGMLYLTTDHERKFVRQAFGQYLAPALLNKLVHAPHLMRLGGEIRQISIMFMDVRAFTPIAEALSAEDLVHFLNTLLSPLSDAIQAELGTIDKYIGDAIMAFWNAPLDIPDHAARACAAALGMRAAIRRLNDEDAFGFRARGLRDPEVAIRIGINTGEACVGNMGSQQRFNYSALGDAVNVASRIESTVKAFGVDILIAEETARVAEGFAMLEAGELALKGKSRPTKMFALIGDAMHAASAQFKALATAHGQLLGALAARDAAVAEAALLACRTHCGSDLARFYQYFEGQLRALAVSTPLAAAQAAE